MFGWRKKNDGFVWHDYVRTTILLKREQRRERVENAIDGLKYAGKQGLQLSAAGAGAAGKGTWWALKTAAISLVDWIEVASTASLLWLADVMAPAALGDLASRMGERLRETAVMVPLALTAAIAGLSAFAHWNDHGFDANTVALTLASVVALALVIFPQIEPTLAQMNWPPATKTLAASRQNFQVAMVMGLTLVAMIGVVSWLVPALTSSASVPLLISSPSAPSGKASSGRIEGKAVAVTGAILRVGSQSVMLSGVEAPETGQLCLGNKGCSGLAKTALQKLLTGKRVICDVTGAGGLQLATAACTINGADIAGQLVRGGYVFATDSLFATYASAEREARTAKLGVWRTDPVRPAVQRAKLWELAKASAPDGCPIKATLAGDTKIYLVPGANRYEKVKVRPDRGERWFCSEADALAAGWKQSDPS